MNHYELINEKLQIFWTIQLEEETVTTCWGRIGSEGKTDTKSYSNEKAAQEGCDALMAAKMEKGYVLKKKTLLMQKWHD